jgi:hypothetical protein
MAMFSVTSWQVYDSILIQNYSNCILCLFVPLKKCMWRLSIHLIIFKLHVGNLNHEDLWKQTLKLQNSIVVNSKVSQQYHLQNLGNLAFCLKRHFTPSFFFSPFFFSWVCHHGCKKIGNQLQYPWKTHASQLIELNETIPNGCEGDGLIHHDPSHPILWQVVITSKSSIGVRHPLLYMGCSNT